MATWHSLKPGADREADERMLKRLIEQHASYTGSGLAKMILDNWTQERKKFIKVFPSEYKRALKELHAAAVAKSAKQVA